MTDPDLEALRRKALAQQDPRTLADFDDESRRQAHSHLSTWVAAIEETMREGYRSVGVGLYQDAPTGVIPILTPAQRQLYPLLRRIRMPNLYALTLGDLLGDPFRVRHNKSESKMSWKDDHGDFHHGTSTSESISVSW